MSNKIHALSTIEQLVIQRIVKQTVESNFDNITRTNSYLLFFQQYPQIKWSFLASSVSRNAGWNMCDLKSKLYKKVLSPKTRKMLFFTYEKANWLIFRDAFPQLLLYHYSTKYRQPMFHLLRYFHVSPIMEKEWTRFWVNNCGDRLLTSLIINEQNIIQQPVINHPVYKNKVFTSFRFIFQQYFHFNIVIFPMCDGELYGASVTNFRDVTNRIDLGKRLAQILFEKSLFPLFYQFSVNTPHTGARYDYEQYVYSSRVEKTPTLRKLFPVVHHQIHHQPTWRASCKKIRTWHEMPMKHKHPIHLTKWYKTKRKQLEIALNIGDFLIP